MAADLASRRVVAILASGLPEALAAKKALLADKFPFVEFYFRGSPPVTTLRHEGRSFS
jgi:hypothetical protein